MHAVARIVWDVVLYRLRRREMVNLLAASSVMLVVGVRWSDTLVRLVFAAVLNIFVYLVNDYFDVEADLVQQSRAPDKTRFLREHMFEAKLAQVALLVLLAGVAWWWSYGLLVTLVLAAGLCSLYSWKLKQVAGLDLAVVLVCGVVSAMTAFPLDRALGWVMAGQLGLFAAAFQTVQMLRDRIPDQRFGTSTTAVRLGERATVVVHRALLVLSASYAAFLLHRWVGLAMLAVVFLPLEARRVEAHWNLLRALLGIAWLSIVVSVLVSGSTDGWLLQLPRDHRLAFLQPIR